METKENEEKMLEIFKKFYKRVNFMALDNLQRPFIFAYSQLVNETVRENTLQSGFDGCIVGRLNPQELQIVIHEQIDPFASKVIH